jgi:hypothetical protein
VTGSWQLNDCQTNVESTTETYPTGCQFDSSNYSPTSSLVICRNAIKSIEYTFTHSQSSSSAIQQVDVFVTLQDLLFDTNTSADSDSTSIPSISQSYSVQWTDIPPSSSISNSSGNVIKRYILSPSALFSSYCRSRSGNPGYLIGKPVLYGTKSGDQILLDDSGFGILTPPLDSLAACPTSTTINSFGEEVINFGYDMLTTCALSLNRSELKKLCCEGDTLCETSSDSIYSNPSGVPFFLSQTSG